MATRKLVQTYKNSLVVMSPSSFIPRLFLNFVFATRATKLLQSGYQKFKKTTFQLIRNDSDVLILPHSLLDEIASLPADVASPHGALERDLLGRYSGLNVILESRMHHSIVQRKLTPRLGVLTPGLERELLATFNDSFPECDEWKEIQPYKIFARISSRLAARALVGPNLCRSPVWLDISVNFTENLFQTIVILRLFPTWLVPIVCLLLPSFWSGRRYIRRAKVLLSPVFRNLIRRNDAGSWSPQPTEEDSNVLCWLADTAKGKDRNPETLAHVEVLLALAAVHTTLLRMVNVLYDLIANPELFDELRNEIHDTHTSGEWSHSSYARLDKLDSVMRESQRMSPPTVLGMKRIFKRPHTFSNGLHVGANTYVCMPTFAIENDPCNITRPEVFNGLRSYKYRVKRATGAEGLKDHKDRNNNEGHLFTSTDRTALSFGYGKFACPGRYFASLVIKMVFVKLLCEYDFRFLDGAERPRNLMLHEFLFSWPWQKILIKRRKNNFCPIQG